MNKLVFNFINTGAIITDIKLKCGGRYNYSAPFAPKGYNGENFKTTT